MRYNAAVLRKILKGLLWTAIIGGVIAVALRLTLVLPWTIPTDDKLMSASMAPTLAGGDTVLVLHAGTPQFGDLVRCIDPDEPRRFVVARVAAEGGDTLEITAGRLIINGKPAPIEHGCGTLQIEDPTTGSTVEMRCDVESLGAGVHQRATRDTGYASTPIARTVPKGHAFLVSDNRSYPADSRLYGTIPIERCKRIVFRLVSKKGFADSKSRFTWIN